jgi:hypothetical protein
MIRTNIKILELLSQEKPEIEAKINTLIGYLGLYPTQYQSGNSLSIVHLQNEAYIWHSMLLYGFCICDTSQQRTSKNLSR